MAAPTASDGDWTADQWLAWLRRSPTDVLPSRHGLNDCADALEREINALRREIVDLAYKLPAIPY